MRPLNSHFPHDALPTLWTWPHHCVHIWERVVPHLPFRTLEFKGFSWPYFVVSEVVFNL